MWVINNVWLLVALFVTQVWWLTGPTPTGGLTAGVWLTQCQPVYDFAWIWRSLKRGKSKDNPRFLNNMMRRSEWKQPGIITQRHTHTVHEYEQLLTHTVKPPSPDISADGTWQVGATSANPFSQAGIRAWSALLLKQPLLSLSGQIN